MFYWFSVIAFGGNVNPSFRFESLIPAHKTGTVAKQEVPVFHIRIQLQKSEICPQAWDSEDA